MSNYTNKITNKNSEIPNFFVNKNSKELGITLIALVITINQKKHKKTVDKNCKIQYYGNTLK